MHLKRKADAFLAAWKADPDRKPLILRGPRHVGKTESVRHFARQAAYESIIEINFARKPKYQGITEDGYSVSDVIRRISLLDPAKQFIPGKTLLFFDEITAFPQITAALKFFCQDGRFDVICCGAMLGTDFSKIESISVGYNKQDWDMHSMDFEEFLWAKGYGEDTVLDMLDHMKSLRPFGETEMTVYRALFLEYTVLGGMPGIVSAYIRNGTFEGSLAAQQQILADWREDISRYAAGPQQARVSQVFSRVAPQLAETSKKFQITKVSPGARLREYRSSIDWLADAGMVNLCCCKEFPELPLGGNYDPDMFKLYLADTGLLTATLDEAAQLDLRANSSLGVCNGALYEDLAAEALVKQGYQLYYYKRPNSTLEAAFFLRSASSLIPIAVKTKSGKEKSLQTLVRSQRYPDIQCGIRLSEGNIGCSSQIYTFPYFCAFLLKRYMETFPSPRERRSSPRGKLPCSRRLNQARVKLHRHKHK